MNRLVTPEKTRMVLDIFSEINAIPRCSGNEQRIAEWVLSRAAEHGFEGRQDRVGNVVVRVPASTGFEKSPVVILQSHMDMVCEKASNSRHDFSVDPIRLVFDGDWLRADDTTLGADNGIGMAVSLAMAEDKSVCHPELELLFTVEEETGLAGAQNLDEKLLTGRILINIDSEQEGTFTIGCAGGEYGHIDLPVTREKIPCKHSLCKLTVSGLRGGHSGMDISEKRGNANEILATALGLLAADFSLRIASLQGGTRSNVIPRDAEARLTIAAPDFENARKMMEILEKTLQKEYAEKDKRLAIVLSRQEPCAESLEVFSQQDSRTCIRLLKDLPHGVHRMSEELEEMVETSNNLAIVTTGKNSVNILCFQRSSSISELQALTSRIGELAEGMGARFRRNGFYPGWPPDLQSGLLARCQEVHRKTFNKEAGIKMTHGGLECGILGSKLPGLDMISLGPTVENAHSPQERVHISSIGTVRDFIAALLGSFAP